MSNRLGAPQLLNVASAVTGASHQQLITVPGQAVPVAWNILIAAFAQWVATATVGTRQLVFQIKNSAGLVLWQSPATAVTASQTANLSAGGGVSPASTTVGTTVNANTALPVDIAVPAGGTIAVVDLAAIDVNDTALLNAVISG